MNGYRYTVARVGAPTNADTHAALNLYSDSAEDVRYFGGTVCGIRGRFQLADGQATCEECIERIRKDQS